MTETPEETARRARVARGGWIAAGIVTFGAGGFLTVVTVLWAPSHWELPVFLLAFGGFLLWNGLTRRLFPARLR